MNAKTHNVQPVNSQVYENYQQLKEEIRKWKDERGAFWKETLRPSESIPYYPVVSFPKLAVFELWERLNRVRGTVSSDLTLSSIWGDFQSGKPLSASELMTNFQMALGGIAQLAREKTIEIDLNTHQTLPNNSSKADYPSLCPICGEHALLSVLTPPNGRRLIHCSLCDYEQPTNRVGCIRCGNEEASKQHYLRTEEFPGIEMVACESCGEYFKEFDLRLLAVEDYIWEDVKSVSLNYATENWFSERALKSGKAQ